jgi:SAM-dependent methyltransferase
MLSTHVDGLVHLDFACGTGRVVSAVESMTAKSIGLDISPNMVSLARKKVRAADLRVGDILESPNIVGFHYDVITAFRFFLNAEPELRSKMMKCLSSRLRGPESRLIFNIHGNRHSMRHLGITYRAIRGEQNSEMTFAEAKSLAEAAGLEIESWFGFGVCPRILHRTILKSFVRFVDRIAAKIRFLRGVSCDLLFVCKPKEQPQSAFSAGRSGLLQLGEVPSRLIELRAGKSPINDLLRKAIDQLTASGNHGAVPAGNELQPGALPASVVVSFNPSKRVRHDLARQGYTNARRFFVLPSNTSPRWLFPLGNAHFDLRGLQIYKPYARGARVLKGLLTAIVAARCQGIAPHQVLVASRGPLPLEALVREVTGECQPVFALSLGTETRFRKLTVQAMRPSGEILGYIKLPLTDAAAELVRHEVEVLNRLCSYPALRSHIPRMLYSGEWGDGAILFESGGPSRPGPVQFNRQCEEFLHLLWGIHTTEKPGQVLWEEVAARWRKAEPSLSSGWRALGQAALAKAKRELDGVMVPCGVAHGDFAPWNMRVGDGRLYVHDWEYASWEAPTSWDVFHFKTQVGALLNKKSNLHISWDRRSGERASFLLYLLNSACWLLDEESADQVISLQRRRQLLEKQLEEY